MGFDRPAQGGRRSNQAHLPHAGEAHVKGAGDGGGAEGEHIHVLAQQLDLFLLLHPKTLLLIHHQQAQLFKTRALAEQLMGAHHHINGAGGQTLQDHLAFRRGAEAIQEGHLERIGGKAFGKGAPVLLGQHRGGGQERTLLASRYRLKHRPDRHLRFAKAHIPTHQAVHGPGRFHVALYIGDRLHLVGGGLVGEGILQLQLPGTIGGEGMAWGFMAFGVELHQVEGHLAHGLAGPLLGLGPGDAAHAVEFRRRIGAGPKTAEAAQLVGGHPQQPIGVLHHQVIAGLTGDGEFLQL